MFGNKSLPSRIYSFGGKPPCEGLEKVIEQMLLAHRYKNALIEADRARRKEVDEALARLSPELAEIERLIAPKEAVIEDARKGIRQASARARRKVVPPDLKKVIQQSKDDLKPLYARRKVIRAVLFKSQEWEREEKPIEERAIETRHRLRGASGLYWGTYLHVEQSMAGIRSGAPPEFCRQDGGGHLAVQIQGGLSAKDLIGGSDRRIRVEPVPPEAWQPGGRKLRKTKVWFRVDSDESGAPVWAVIPIVLHRPIPEDAQVKWVHLIRWRIATKCEWRVQFILSRERGWAKEDVAREGTVGIDVGWRIRPDGSLRTAFWTGSDGRKGELVLPADWLSEMKKTRDLRSIRDGLLNDILEVVCPKLKTLPLPEWLKEASATIAQWRSQARLAALTIQWRDKRFEGDIEVFDLLEAWRKRDKHLYEYQENLRDQLQSRRQDIYRVFAAKARRVYKTAVIEDLHLPDFHELPEDEEPTVDGALKEHVRDACISLLFQCLKESMATTLKAPAQNTTRLHCDCGSIEDWDRKELEHKCSRCSRIYDQDENASRNLLEWGLNGGDSKVEPEKPPPDDSKVDPEKPKAPEAPSVKPVDLNRKQDGPKREEPPSISAA